MLVMGFRWGVGNSTRNLIWNIYLTKFPSVDQTTWPSLLGLWGLEHTSHLARAVIAVQTHLHYVEFDLQSL